MTAPSASPRGAAPAAAGLSERIVLVFLVAATVVLSYVYFHVMPSRNLPAPEPFDLVNPMLDARVGETVEIESTTNPGEIICVRVREPGVVRRTRQGPPRLGIYRDLQRSRPYLACGIRYPPPGKRCADPGTGREDVELFDLNAFGMPSGIEVGLEIIRPLWVQRGGRYLFVYEVQLKQYRPPGGPTWYVYLNASAPVTGTVLRRHATDRGQIHETIFTSAP